MRWKLLRRRLSITRVLGGALLTLSIVPIVTVALLAYPATAPATHDALARLGQTSPFAASLVARLDALVPGPAPDPTPDSGSDRSELATTR